MWNGSENDCPNWANQGETFRYSKHNNHNYIAEKSELMAMIRADWSGDEWIQIDKKRGGSEWGKNQRVKDRKKATEIEN